jgi:hypothetical protein
MPAMQLSEQRFRAISRYGGIALAVSVMLNVYFVMRHFEVYRDAVRADRQVQMLVQQQPVIQATLQEFVNRAGTDAQVREILDRHQLLPGKNPPQRSRP